MKWLKLFEEYSDDKRIELANNIFLTSHIMKELNAMKLNRVEKRFVPWWSPGIDYHYIYYYTGTEGKEKLKFLLYKRVSDPIYIPRLLSTSTIPRKLCDKFSSKYADEYIFKLFAKHVGDFLIRKKYITDPISIDFMSGSDLGGYQTALKKAIKEKSDY